MTSHLSSSHRKQLSTWLGGNKQFKLLYSTATDECGASAFHSKCDNLGATVTVARNTAGWVFGGYTNVSWGVTSSSYSYDDRAFLFRLDRDGSFQPKKYRLKDEHEKRAICQNSSCGPYFGEDLLFLNEGPYQKEDGFFPCEPASKHGADYDMAGDTATDFTGNDLELSAIDVYKVQDANVEFDDPWRNIGNADHGKLMTQLERYCPVEEAKLDHVNLLLVGAVGSGKSSYFNTINSMFKGHVTGQARSGSTTHSLTQGFKVYKVRSKSGTPLKFRLCDTRGLEGDNGMKPEDLVAFLDGHVENGFQFNPFTKLGPETRGYRKSPSFEDTAHCVVFVVDASTVDVFSDKILEVVKEFQESANARGVPQVVLLTKVGKVCPFLDKDLSGLFKTITVSDLVDTVAQMFGIPRSCVLPIKNYEKETELDVRVDVPALLSLQQILRLADDYLYYHVDQNDN
ncbi:interferon-induced protein 44-like [Haliotis rubra]|uniref:interferon-induced protein 44-like n=1 Tax=Haliotis rubra TaxID=36100 RepID=UPI001EE501BE|nr:interferon-induced protein 44-like [Haliotis rubra]XP_046564053.1 interferon-induced protein 44-like [Haliotis rubra]XP_046564054.1 interferon-induced protein 44-like [Haliotis rubra]